MKPAQQPSKEQPRACIQQRTASKMPPPAEIRRILGWSLLVNNRCADCAR